MLDLMTQSTNFEFARKEKNLFFFFTNRRKNTELTICGIALSLETFATLQKVQLANWQLEVTNEHKSPWEELRSLLSCG